LLRRAFCSPSGSAAAAFAAACILSPFIKKSIANNRLHINRTRAPARLPFSAEPERPCDILTAACCLPWTASDGIFCQTLKKSHLANTFGRKGVIWQKICLLLGIYFAKRWKKATWQTLLVEKGSFGKQF